MKLYELRKSAIQMKNGDVIQIRQGLKISDYIPVIEITEKSEIGNKNVTYFKLNISNVPTMHQIWLECEVK